ncbi:Nif3-like dinuclear metal center hexameric protein [Psychrosphaera aquimarina]|uniref:Nif3-like dinuclear metal center hexameric protein n=1 Tax=Psychrosphaera aquimarina TaxID=2044854 RepID=A0ABU3R4W6_9GAMM|nr:Nif3-like dinuclear metal center hexameric protein [Psychrosphaera aquimarina]MDU0114721.1 Nif3-like dinuclear metal center hexameric protein [Psychrosphaera aquimarina]
MKTKQLTQYLNTLLNSDNINDYCPNGLQVEGKPEIGKIITGVTASERLIDAAIEHQADAILVHHGYFWKGESQVITGLKKNRLAKLLKHDINLLAYHLPIDVHSDLGNNAVLANLLGITNVVPVESVKPKGVLMQGKLSTPMSIDQFGQLVNSKLQREPLINAVNNELVSTIAWCTGGGQGYIDVAAELGVDVFLTGEASEQTIHSSREFGIHFVAAGHHATERYGVKSVGEHLANEFGLDVQFVDIHNPV